MFWKINFLKLSESSVECRLFERNFGNLFPEEKILKSCFLKSTFGESSSLNLFKT